MVRLIKLISVTTVFALTSCVAENSIQKQIDLLTPNVSALNSTVKEMHGIVITVKGCHISSARIATCNFTAKSKFQDRTMNLLGSNYVNIQDDTGVSYPTQVAFGNDPTNKSQRATTLIADTPYNFTIMAQNISTQATKVRAITISRMDVRGPSGIRYIKTNFSHPPIISEAKQTPTQYTDTKELPSGVSEEKTHSNATQTPYNGTAYTYLFAKIEPINEHIPVDPTIKSLWSNGAYLYLNPDGRLGHNWSKPGPYAYIPQQTWKIKGNQLVIAFGNATYSFDLNEKTSPMVTYLDQGGVFKMSAYKKGKNQK